MVGSAWPVLLPTAKPHQGRHPRHDVALVALIELAMDDSDSQDDQHEAD